jgi:N-carbamoylputrescine amidase
VGKLTASHRYDLRTLAAVKPWGIPRELVVQDFPIVQGAKVRIKFNKQKFCVFYFFFVILQPQFNSNNRKYMRAGIIQQHNIDDKTVNINRLIDKIRKCAEGGAELVVLQELHNSLYFCQTENVDLFDGAETVPGVSTEIYGKIAKECNIVIVTSLFEKRAPGIYHNTAVVFEKDGSIAGTYRKMHIPDDPAYYEKFYFTPGDTGFEPIQTSVGALGVLVCWDQWFPEAARLMALKGADLLIYPTAIGWESTDCEDEKKRQQDAWQTVQRGHAVANGLHVITVNRVGEEPDPSGQTNGIRFWGHSFVSGPQGEIIYQSPDDKEDTKIIDIDLQRSEQVRRWWPFFRDRRIDAYQEILKRGL